MMISCQEAQRLLSEQMDRPLSLGERGKLWFHLSMCRVCTKVKRQLALIRWAARRLGQSSDRLGLGVLSPQAKQRLTDILKAKRG